MHIKIGVSSVTALPTYNNCSVSGLQPRTICLYPGFDAEVLHQLLKLQGITYDLIPLGAAEFRLLDYSFNWTGILGEIFHQRIDTVAYTVIMTDLRSEYFDFTYPVISDPYNFVYKRVDLSFSAFSTTLLRV